MGYGDLFMEKISNRLGTNLVQYFPITFLHREAAFYFFPLPLLNRNYHLPPGARGFPCTKRGSLLRLCQRKQLRVFYYGSSVAEIVLYHLFLAWKIFERWK